MSPSLSPFINVVIFAESSSALIQSWYPCWSMILFSGNVVLVVGFYKCKELSWIVSVAVKELLPPQSPDVWSLLPILFPKYYEQKLQ